MPDEAPETLQRRHWESMGSQASLVMATHEPDVVEEAADLAREQLAQIEAQFSSYRPDSEVSRFAAGGIDEPSAELVHVLAACSWLEQATAGAFTTCISGRLDLAGYVKGWAIDQAADALAATGFDSFCLGVGGDWRAVGSGPGQRPWRLAVLDPQSRDRPRAIVELVDGAIATSGTYERGLHIIGAQAGQVGGQLASFSVVGPRLAWADAFATAGFVMGEAGIGWVGQFEQYSAALIGSDGQMFADDRFPLAADAVAPLVHLAAPYGQRLPGQ